MALEDLLQMPSTKNVISETYCTLRVSRTREQEIHDILSASIPDISGASSKAPGIQLVPTCHFRLSEDCSGLEQITQKCIM